jgi:hypothetical protein
VSVPAHPAPLFADIDDVARRLAETGYLSGTATATAVFLADRLPPTPYEHTATTQSGRAAHQQRLGQSTNGQDPADQRPRHPDA